LENLHVDGRITLKSINTQDEEEWEASDCMECGEFLDKSRKYYLTPPPQKKTLFF
jgi:hypothetical protein